MALKDWIGYKFKSKSWFEKTWYHENGSSIQVFENEENGKYFTRIIDSKNTDRAKYKMFKTKSQALKFAKSYMRKH